jgi:ATP-dependent Clp protease adaptor protein ClpS
MPLAQPEVFDETIAEVAATWTTVVWDDPVNLMSYVTHVFMTYFGYSRPRSHKLMMQVHTQGRSVVAAGARELMEAHASAMHAYGLHATVEKE